MLLAGQNANLVANQEQGTGKNAGRLLVSTVGRPHGQSRHLFGRQPRLAQGRASPRLFETRLAVLRDSLAVKLVSPLVLRPNLLPVMAAELPHLVALRQVPHADVRIPQTCRVNGDGVQVVILCKAKLLPHEARLVTRAQVDMIFSEHLDEARVDVRDRLVQHAQGPVLFPEALDGDRGLAGVDPIVALAAETHPVVGKVASALVPRHHVMAVGYRGLAARHPAFPLLAGENVVLDAVEAPHLPALVVDTAHGAVVELHEGEPVDLEAPVGHVDEFAHLAGPVQMRPHELGRCRSQPALRALAVLEAGLGVDDVLNRNHLLAARELASAGFHDLVVGLPELVAAALSAEPLTRS